MAGELGSGGEAGVPDAQTAPEAATSQSPSAAAGQPNSAPAPVADAGAGGTPAPQTAEQIAQQSLSQAPTSQPAAQTVTTTPVQPAAPQLPPDVQAQIDEYRRLQQQLPQLQQYAQLGVEAYRQQQAERQRQLQAEQQAQASKSWFDLPQFDPGLMEFIEQDPATGEVRAKPGAPPDTLAQYKQFSKSLAELQLRFWRNPQEVIGEHVRREAAAVAQQLIQQHFGGYRDEVAANQLLQQNAGWLYAAGPDGGRTLTPAGRLYAEHVQQAIQYGIRGSQAQHDYAVDKVRLALLLAERQQQQAQAAGDASKQQLLQAQVPAAGGLPATPASVPPRPAEVQPGGPQSLRDMLRRSFKENGITDETFRAV